MSSPNGRPPFCFSYSETAWISTGLPVSWRSPSRNAPSRSRPVTPEIASQATAVPSESAASGGVSPDWVALCQDPQTSGGLLLAIRPGKVDAYQALAAAAGISAPIIGRVTDSGAPGEPIVWLT